MDDKHPFSITEEEKSELRNVSRLLFWGQDPQQQPETNLLYHKWRLFFDIFLQSIDRRTGSFLHLPFLGGTCEQPSKTMVVLSVLQSVYLEKLNEDPQL